MNEKDLGDTAVRFYARIASMEAITMENLSIISRSIVLVAKVAMALGLLITSASFGFSQTASNGPGWYLTNYSFKDGSYQKQSVLMGTTLKLKDVVSFKGTKGNLRISHLRYYVSNRKTVASITYQVTWTDPATFIKPGAKTSFVFGLSTVSALTWKAPQQSMHINQGMGVYFVTPDGTKYMTKDIRSKLTTEKVIEKGSRGTKRIIQMNFGKGFTATYNYEWRDQ
ncbi:MAG: hypothetical protein KA831_05835 [Pyrinomonadaceae bacterium]|nr:hypothetical protein [Pyrinomonadaceae bacterium]